MKKLLSLLCVIVLSIVGFQSVNAVEFEENQVLLPYLSMRVFWTETNYSEMASLSPNLKDSLDNHLIVSEFGNITVFGTIVASFDGMGSFLPTSNCGIAANEDCSLTPEIYIDISSWSVDERTIGYINTAVDTCGFEFEDGWTDTNVFNNQFYHWATEPLNIYFTRGHNTPINVKLYQLDYNGQRTLINETNVSVFLLIGHYGNSYSWTFAVDDFFPYEVVVDDVSVRKGHIAPEPSADFQSKTRAVAMGLDIALNEDTDGNLHDSYEFNQFQFEMGEPVIVYFKFNANDKINGFSISWIDHTAGVWNSGLQIMAEDLFTMFDDDMGFFILNPIGTGTLPVWNDPMFDSLFIGQSPTRNINLKPLFYDVGESVFTYHIRDATPTTVQHGESVYITYQNAPAISIVTNKVTVRDGNTIKNTIVLKDHVRELYTDTVTITDTLMGNQTGTFNILNMTNAIQYTVRDFGQVGSSAVEMVFDNDWWTPFGDALTDEYTIQYSTSYTVTQPRSIDEVVDDAFISWRIGGTMKNVIIAVVFIFMMITLMFLKAPFVAYLMVLFGLLGMFVALTLIPAWMVIGVALIAVTLIILKFKGGGGGA